LVNGGVELELYRVLTPILGLKHNNNRDHRKLLIVDGNVAYTGGAGYSNSWMGDARNPMEWRDTMYEITGKAVADTTFKEQRRLLSAGEYGSSEGAGRYGRSFLPFGD